MDISTLCQVPNTTFILKWLLYFTLSYLDNLVGLLMLSSQERNKKIRKLLNLTQQQFADAVNLSVHYIKDIERKNGKNISVRYAAILADKIVKTPEGIVRLVTNKNPAKDLEQPLSREWVVYGTGPMFRITNNYFEIKSNTDNNIIILQNSDNIKYFTMPDNSMLPEINKGHIFAIDTSKKEIQNDKVYYISTGNKTLLRQIQNIDFDKLLIKTFNNAEELTHILDKKDVQIIGQFYFSCYFPRY